MHAYLTRSLRMTTTWGTARWCSHLKTRHYVKYSYIPALLPRFASYRATTPASQALSMHLWSRLLEYERGRGWSIPVHHKPISKFCARFVADHGLPPYSTLSSKVSERGDPAVDKPRLSPQTGCALHTILLSMLDPPISLPRISPPNSDDYLSSKVGRYPYLQVRGGFLTTPWSTGMTWCAENLYGNTWATLNLAEAPFVVDSKTKYLKFTDVKLLSVVHRYNCATQPWNLGTRAPARTLAIHKVATMMRPRRLSRSCDKWAFLPIEDKATFLPPKYVLLCSHPFWQTHSRQQVS